MIDPKFPHTGDQGPSVLAAVFLIIVGAIAWVLLAWGMWAMFNWAITPAHADEAPAARLLMYDPPPGWHGRPVPTTVLSAPYAQLPAVCGLAPGRLVGCARREKTKCTIIVAQGMPQALLREVLTHEQAHCQGWTHKGD